MYFPKLIGVKELVLPKFEMRVLISEMKLDTHGPPDEIYHTPNTTGVFSIIKKYGEPESPDMMAEYQSLNIELVLGGFVPTYRL